jgi:hypothetical protein
MNRILTGMLIALALAGEIRSAAVADVSEAAIDRAQRSIVIVECKDRSGATSHLTGVILLSQAARSYIAVGEALICTDYRVRLNGNTTGLPLPARVVAIDQAAAKGDALKAADFSAGNMTAMRVEGLVGGGSKILAIEKGGLTAVPYAQPHSGHASLFILSYAESVFAMMAGAKRVDPRLDQSDTANACSDFDFDAASALGQGAPLFAADGALVAITVARQPGAAMLDPSRLKEARQNYVANNLFDWIALLHYASDNVGVSVPAWRC